MRRLFCAAAFLAYATAGTAAVTPTVTCWTSSTGDGLVTVAFGYENTSATTETIAIGASNFFTPEPIDRFQPDTFEPGVHDNVFRVTVSTDALAELAWSINGVLVMPNPTTDAECSMCFCAAGAEGPAGNAGPSGPAGAIGPEGSTGETGDPGPRGVAGPAGIAGEQGPIGPKGATGLQGLAGAAGPQGIAGPAGPMGPKGATGDRGADAAPAPDGPEGPVGPAGDRGPVGEAGAAGLAGPPGAGGAAGDRGPSGEAGPRGPKGFAGLPGVEGARGLPGAAGATGPRGADGAVTFLAGGILAGTSSGASSSRFVVESDATIVVAGVIELRSDDASEVAVLLDGSPFARVRVNGGGRWMTYPVHASIRVTPGEHDVQLALPDGTEAGTTSISFSAAPREAPSRRRLVTR